VEDQVDAVQAIIDVHEAARLLSVTPYFDFQFTREFGLDYFPANGRRRFLAAAIPGSTGTIDIMEASHACGYAKIFPERTAHPLAKQLLPSISILRCSRIGVLFA